MLRFIESIHGFNVFVRTFLSLPNQKKIWGKKETNKRKGSYIIFNIFNKSKFSKKERKKKEKDNYHVHVHVYNWKWMIEERLFLLPFFAATAALRNTRGSPSVYSKNLQTLVEMIFRYQ